MFVLKLLSRLPLGVLYVIADILFFFSYYIIRYRRKLVAKNLAKSFPEKSKKERKRIERAFFHNLCDYGVETLKLLTITREELGKRHTFKNPEILDVHKKNNTPIIILASHQFNWEWLLTSANLFFILDFVYQPVQNNFTDKLLLTCRTRLGGHAITRNSLGREIVKRKNIWRLIGIVSDQYPGQRKDKKYITQFLNQETAFFEGTNQLASLTQYPFFFTAIRKIKRGYYETTFVPLTEPPYQKEKEGVIDAYAQAAEKLIREYPEGWLWSHKRWKKRHLTQAAVNVTYQNN